MDSSSRPDSSSQSDSLLSTEESVAHMVVEKHNSLRECCCENAFCD
jgi:hypothetical protein